VSGTVYVDENKARGFRLAAVLTQDSDARRARAALRGHVAAGAHRVHFVKERPARRRAILATIASLGVIVVVIEAPIGCRASEQRHATIAELTRWACAMGARRIVVERDENSIALDRRVIESALAGLPGGRELEYAHVPARSEPLLWTADAVAWSWARGGEWRQLVELMGTTVIRA
jgi:hypothetical protein